MFNLYKAVVQSMELQDKANRVMAGDGWTGKGIDWVTCSAVELGEGLSWLGYKHWKKQEANFHQAFIEIVDSYHFMLSLAIEKKLSAELLGSRAECELERHKTLVQMFEQETDLDRKKTIGKKAFKSLAYTCLTSDGDHQVLEYVVREHLEAAARIGFDAQAFFAGYLPKNVLNLFRQKNGDREGRYPRMWVFDGEEIEDNQVVEILVKRNPELAYDSHALETKLQSILDGIVASKAA